MRWGLRYRLVWAQLFTSEGFILHLQVLHASLIQEHLVDGLHLLVPDDFHVRGQLQVLSLQVLHLQLQGGDLLILQGQLGGHREHGFLKKGEVCCEGFEGKRRQVQRGGQRGMLINWVLDG